MQGKNLPQWETLETLSVTELLIAGIIHFLSKVGRGESIHEPIHQLWGL